MWLLLQLRHNNTNFTSSGKPQPTNDTSCSFFLGGTLNYCAVCPLCTWVAQLGSLPVLWGGYTVVPWSLPHLLPYAPVQVTRQDELHQLATHRENLSDWLCTVTADSLPSLLDNNCLIEQLEVFRLPGPHQWGVPSGWCWATVTRAGLQNAAVEVRKSVSSFGTSCIVANVAVKVAASLWNQILMTACQGFSLGLGIIGTFLTS